MSTLQTECEMSAEGPAHSCISGPVTLEGRPGIFTPYAARKHDEVGREAKSETADGPQAQAKACFSQTFERRAVVHLEIGQQKQRQRFVEKGQGCAPFDAGSAANAIRATWVTKSANADPKIP